MRRPVLLMILDGFGLRDEPDGNAVAAAHTPNLDCLCAAWPQSRLNASGLAVGLPEGQMGNSEVGHTNIGAGRIVYQELTRITKSVADGDFFENPVLAAAMDAAKGGHTLHLMGLLSDGGVHSHNTHLYALLEMAKRRGVESVAVHCFLDGRDTPPDSGAGYLTELQGEMDRIGVGAVATVVGRYYAMDRDKRWERVARAYRLLTEGSGAPFTDAAAAVRASVAAGVTDEFVEPLAREGFSGVREGDAVIFYNFRPDRARELTRAFVDADFAGFARERIPLSSYVCMTCYDAAIEGVGIAFRPEEPRDTFGEIVSRAGLRQLRIAETEKYAHVTFFFNGGVEEPFPGEERILVPSPKVATYDLKPEMSAYEVTDRLLEALSDHCPDAVILNYANCDMVGHTGVFEAAVRAVEAVDACVGRVCDKVLALGGVVLLTADHGNAETMVEPDGAPMTAHTTNPVPFVSIGENRPLRDCGALCDLAPTMLELLGLDRPAAMTGQSMFAKEPAAAPPL